MRKIIENKDGYPPPPPPFHNQSFTLNFNILSSKNTQLKYFPTWIENINKKLNNMR